MESIKEKEERLASYKFEMEHVYEGFVFKRSEQLKDIKCDGYLFEHEKTKAKLVYIKSPDENKVFSIGFRTPPTNNTGIPHIIEHSVLCGSKKYPAKEPFVELLKSSLKTFLNAMTFPDKTLYPVASMNEKDFMNLMNVYLDAVFYPNIYNKKEIFMQEGWHYELLNKKDPLTYKGVVYNEMKGVYSSPDSVLFYESCKSLFPDTIYAKEYGGYPEEIPDLSYEEFLAFHKKYYHPSNSYIYIYGDMDPQKVMKEINEKYLRDFEYQEIDSKINPQEKLTERNYIEKPYAVENDSDDISNKNLLSINFAMPHSESSEQDFALKVLEDYLMDEPASPLRKVVIEKGLCSDMGGFVESDLLQPMFTLEFQEITKENKEVIIKNVFDELERIVREGIDHELMESIINQREFFFRRPKSGEPAGLQYNYRMYETWLYDGNPFSPLYFDEKIKNIREKLHDGYFEKLIKELLVENTHSSIVMLTPDLKLKEQNEEKLKNKLADIKAKMSAKEINEVIKNTKNLMKAQLKPDSKEVLKTIPMLSLDDIDKKAEEFDIDIENINGIKTYKKEGDTNKISYVSFSFDTSGVANKDLPALNLLTNLLIEVSTKNMSYDDISKKIGKAAGFISFGCGVIMNPNNMNEYNSSATCHLESLQDKRGEMIDIASEVINNTVFTEDAKIKEIISRLRVTLEQSFPQDGHTTVAQRMESYYSQSGKYAQAIGGIDFYEYITDLDSNYEERKEELKAKLEELRKTVFNVNNLSCSVVCEEGKYAETVPTIEKFAKSLENEGVTSKDQKNREQFELEELNEGFKTQSDVQYVGLAGNFRKLGYDFNGKMLVLRHILEYDYL
ncbi:MAG: insulinase family protein [Clostridia bacterium]|nr:insulinase family protein [Clostridia bacterium]